jgi:SH3 domain-containing protein
MRALLTLGLIAAIGYATNGAAEPANTAFSPSKQDEVHAVVVDEPRVDRLPRGSGEISDLVEASGQLVETVPPDRAEPEARNLLRVSSPTNIRSDPSPSAEIIGIAPAGASVRAAARYSEWVLIVDPWSWETGWIHSKSLAPFSAIQLRCSLTSWIG